MPSQAKLFVLNTVSETRGEISILEIENEIGFAAKRFFIVSGVPSNEKRGQHAHIEGEQLLIAVNGSLMASVFDGSTTQEFELDSSKQALFMPKMTWGSQWNFSKDAKLLVLCSNTYEPEDYITNFQEFTSNVKQNPRPQNNG